MNPDDRAMLRVAGAYVGTPYVLRGRDPAGWDCWGLVRYLRPLLFNKATPCWGELYGPEDAPSFPKLAVRTEQLIMARISAWRPVPARAGAVALFEVFGRKAHVGLMLDHVNFIHAQPGCETVVSRLDDLTWRPRYKGAFDG